MMLLALLVIPLSGAALSWRAVGRRATALHTVTAVLTLMGALAVAVTVNRGEPLVAFDGFLRADALSAWMIALIGIVAALAASEAPRYVAHTAPGRFYPLFHLFVFTMLLAVSTDDVGLMWVAVEGTTLASVFLVNFERTRASLEASYKYLLICSVGIAIAFLGTVLVYFAGIQQFGDEAHALRWTTLVRLAPALSPRVLQLAFVFLVVGYGTKAGLAPMHTWLPDAHSEAPAPVSALMSGVLLSVGVYAILRFKPAVDTAAGPGFARGIMMALGMLSVAVAAAFLWTSPNYKRMLAYSSIEHTGLMCVGLALGPLGTFAAMLHLLNHTLAKSTMFFLAGRVLHRYRTTEIGQVSGLLRTMPWTGGLFAAGMLAVIGLPPFGLFISEFALFRAGFAAGRPWLMGLILALLTVAFVSMIGHLNRMLYGAPSAGTAMGEGNPWPLVPLGACMAVLGVLGFTVPAPLQTLLERIVEIAGP
jgi:hydrogenase-4 component F